MKIDKCVVLINGLAGVGKDTFVELCKETSKVPVNNYHRSDRAKEILNSLGWDGVKTPEVRKLLADLVNFGETTRQNYLNFLYELLNSKGIFFYHVREPERIEQLKVLLCMRGIPYNTLLITRPIKSEESDTWGLLDYDYGKVIENDGSLEDLKAKAADYVEEIIKVLNKE